MWMPTASDEAVEFPVPMHPNLDVISVCVQPFTNCEYSSAVDGFNTLRLTADFQGPAG